MLLIPDPFALNVTVVDGPTVLRMPCRIVVPGVMGPLPPCQEMVQPPLWWPMLSAFLPATKMRLLSRASGRMLPAFFSTTCDSRTACRARFRCAALPTVEVQVRSVSGRSNRPSSNFLVRIRRFASSMRAIVTRPACTSVRSRSMNVRHSYGTITMSMPALMAVRTSAAVKPGAPSIWSMPFQSDTTKPENPSSPLRTVVMRYWWPCSLTPFQEL